jgi:hypothetical protein
MCTYEILQLHLTHSHFVHKREVVGWYGCALDAITRLEKEVRKVRVRGTCVDKRTRSTVAIVWHLLGWLREVTRVVSLCNNDGSELELRWICPFAFFHSLFKRLADLGQLIVFDMRVLAGYIISTG